MKTLQEQYNLIKEGKGSKETFLKEAKRIFPNMITNAAGFNETTQILKNRQVITENYIDLQPINSLGIVNRTSWESKFAEFLAEEAKVDGKIHKDITKSGQEPDFKKVKKYYIDKEIEFAKSGKALDDKTYLNRVNKLKTINDPNKFVSAWMRLTGANKWDLPFELEYFKESVNEGFENNFDYKDVKNLDNQIGQEVLNGIYFEAKQNPDKTLDEIREIVSKNLAKDGQYYMKSAAFGVEGIGYQETELEEVSGKHASSGYSDKLKKVVKESLTGGTTEVVKEEKEEKKEAPKAKKAKKESIDTDLAEIDKQAQIVALEAKLDKMDEVIESKMSRINMVSEDENLSELVDKKKMKAMQKEVKILERRKAKIEKMYEKMCGKAYRAEEIVDESLPVNEDLTGTTTEDLNQIAQSEFGLDFDQLGENEKEWVRDEFERLENLDPMNWMPYS